MQLPATTPSLTVSKDPGKSGTACLMHLLFFENRQPAPGKYLPVSFPQPADQRNQTVNAGACSQVAG